MGLPLPGNAGSLTIVAEILVFGLVVLHFLGTALRSWYRYSQGSAITTTLTDAALQVSETRRGTTLVEENVVNEAKFWKHSRYTQLLIYGLALLGTVVAYMDDLTFGFVFPFFATANVYVSDQRLSVDRHLHLRWRSICYMFMVSLFFFIAELFRYAFQEPMSSGRWTCITILGLVVLVTGVTPGMPRRIAVGGHILDVIKEEEDIQQVDETPSVMSMEIAATSAMHNTPLGFLFFWHVYPLIKLALTRKRLTSSDVPVMGPDMQAETLGATVQQLFREHLLRTNKNSDAPAKSRSKPSLFSRETLGLVRVLVLANAVLFQVVVSLTIAAVALYYGPAFFANRIFEIVENERRFIESPTQTFRRSLPWVMALFMTVIGSSTLQGILWSCLEGSLALRLTTQVSTLLYSKTLRRQQMADVAGEGKGSNQVVTLFLVDLQRVVAVSFHLFAAITTPLELLLGGYFAYRVIGISAVAGLGTTVMLMPFIGLLSRAFARANELLMSARDSRMGLLNEVFLGIRMIKSQAWEDTFQTRVNKLRKKERFAQKWTFVYDAALASLLELNPILVTLVAFAFYTLVLGHTLTPTVAFTSLAVFSELRWTLVMLPRAVTDFLQTLVSARRIAEYLVSEDVTQPSMHDMDQDALRHIRFEDATVAWPRADDTPTFSLSNVNVEFPVGKTLICGRVGCGKTLMLQALLHETAVHSGRVLCPRSPHSGVPPDAASSRRALNALNTPAWLRSDLVAFAPQVPFLLNSTIRDNILFGLPLGDGKRYQATLEACSLRSDLKLLEFGDLTPVGENGTELSGGQKARVGLARALYSRAATVLLDDVLSAVDTGTAKHIADHLTGPLLDERTVLLVSHNVQLLGTKMDKVVCLDGGRVAFDGTPAEFVESEHYSGVLETEKHEEEVHKVQKEPGHLPDLAQEGTKRAGERRETGGIAWKVWRAYIISSSGWTLCLTTMLLFTIANLWELVTNGWLRDWSTSHGRGHDNGWWLSRYAALLSIGIGFNILRWVSLYTMSLRASRTLFAKMLARTMRAPLRFFDQTTRGRLLNRFGQDMTVVDSTFARAIADVAIRVTQLLATTIALCLVGGPGFAVALLVTLPVYGALAQHYLVVARDLQRLNSTSRSLVVSSFNHAVHGVQVIRAFGAQARFTNEFLSMVDNNNRFVWWTAHSSRWVSQMYNLVSSVLVLAACALVLLKRDTTPASVDFSLTFLIDLNFTLLLLLRMYTALQTNGVAVERVYEFADRIESEAATKMEPAPADNWPQRGQVDVENLVLRYAPDAPDVLHGVSFNVPAGTKLAIVGPTGSGKSTLVSAFLRFLEPREGTIRIDGWDIAKVGLYDLRSRLQIVPQDPVILSGTLRNVLDVMSEYTDEQLLESLKRVQLITPGSPDFTDLSMPIAENGANLSQGQRQLLCLARAILRQATVVLFDEASSSIDYTTDMVVTQVIQEAFRQSTVLTIAHRLRSVIAYDKVLVLEQGRVAEFGEPSKLLNDSSSRFYKLCQHAGPTELKLLQEMARMATESHHS